MQYNYEIYLVLLVLYLKVQAKLNIKYDKPTYICHLK